TIGAARIKAGLQKELVMGNLESSRDWGYAGDYVRAMRLMLQQKQADDYVVGSGETHQGKEFAELAFARLGMDYRDYVRTDPQFMRPAEVDLLIADPSKAEKQLGWKREVSFQGLVDMMVDSDFAAESKAQAAAVS